MIKYRLGCPERHEFESWFRSSVDYDALSKDQLIACPQCGSHAIEKLPMAPAIISSKAILSRAPLAPPTPEGQSAIAQQLREFRAALKANAEDVGNRFAEEVRLIHHGDADDRSIYGSSTAKEAQELAEEGISFGVLPDLPDDRN